MPAREAPAPDVGIALQAAATRLRYEFNGVGSETIERLLHSRYDQYARDATVMTFLPLLAERAARQELKSIAGSSGGDFVEGCLEHEHLAGRTLGPAVTPPGRNGASRPENLTMTAGRQEVRRPIRSTTAD